MSLLCRDFHGEEVCVLHSGRQRTNRGSWEASLWTCGTRGHNQQACGGKDFNGVFTSYILIMDVDCAVWLWYDGHHSHHFHCHSQSLTPYFRSWLLPSFKEIRFLPKVLKWTNRFYHVIDLFCLNNQWGNACHQHHSQLTVYVIDNFKPNVVFSANSVIYCLSKVNQHWLAQMSYLFPSIETIVLAAKSAFDDSAQISEHNSCFGKFIWWTWSSTK